MPEQRLIDANVLSDKVAESKHNNPHQQGMVRVNHRNEHDHFLRMISIAPTIDAVEVVRCKDCKSYCHIIGKGDRAIFGCSYMGRDVKPDDFCSYGERRTDG